MTHRVTKVVWLVPHLNIWTQNEKLFVLNAKMSPRMNVGFKHSGTATSHLSVIRTLLLLRSLVSMHSFARCGTTHAWPSPTDPKKLTWIMTPQSPSSGCQIYSLNRAPPPRSPSHSSQMLLCWLNQMETSLQASGNGNVFHVGFIGLKWIYCTKFWEFLPREASR